MIIGTVRFVREIRLCFEAVSKSFVEATRAGVTTHFGSWKRGVNVKLEPFLTFQLTCDQEPGPWWLYHISRVPSQKGGKNHMNSLLMLQ